MEASSQKAVSHLEGLTMEPQCGDAPAERVPLHFYEEFLTYAAELEYLKAEVALLKRRHENDTSPKRPTHTRKGVKIAK
jgi:hypothetical protein